MADEHQEPAAGEQPAAGTVDGESVEWAVRIQTWAGDQIVRYPHPSRANAKRDLAEALRLRSPGELVHLVQRRVSPWQRAGEALPDLVAPPTAAREVPALVCLNEAEATGPAVSPDCRDGKCTACVGEAWDEDAGEVTECEHPCHEAADAPDEDLFPMCQPQVGRHDWCRGVAVGELAGVLPDCCCACHGGRGHIPPDQTA